MPAMYNSYPPVDVPELPPQPRFDATPCFNGVYVIRCNLVWAERMVSFLDEFDNPNDLEAELLEFRKALINRGPYSFNAPVNDGHRGDAPPAFVVDKIFIDTITMKLNESMRRMLMNFIHEEAIAGGVDPVIAAFGLALRSPGNRPPRNRHRNADFGQRDHSEAW